MAQNTRTELKNKFKRGMYPTEGDFANVFDSYVHKDDMVELEKVVQTIGNEQKTLATIINESKREAIAAAVQQVGKSEALTGIQNRLTTAEDAIDAAEDNIAGHETRIQTLETSKSDYEKFKERVRAFLEDSDASDETINRWHEIESFLQGITDTETLTGLLTDLKQEILASIPEPELAQQGNYLKQIADLDAYSEAYDGEIVQYVGQTTDSYTRGFLYERKKGEAKTITINEVSTSDFQALIPGDQFTTEENPEKVYWYGRCMDERSRPYCCYSATTPAVDGTIYVMPPDLSSVTPCRCVAVTDNGDGSFRCEILNESFPQYRSGQNLNVNLLVQQDAVSMLSFPDGDYIGFIGANMLVCVGNEWGRLGSVTKTVDIPSQSSWQHLHIDNVIS